MSANNYVHRGSSHFTKRWKSNTNCKYYYGYIDNEYHTVNLCCEYYRETNKKMEFNILQLTEGNLDISVEEKIKKRNDEIGSMSESLARLSYQLKNSMTEIQNVSEKLLNSEEELNQMVGELNYVATQINSSTQKN